LRLELRFVLRFLLRFLLCFAMRFSGAFCGAFFASVFRERFPVRFPPALRGEAAGGGGVRERHAGECELTHAIEPPHRQIAVRARAEQRAKVVRQAPAVASGGGRQFVERHRALERRQQIFAGPPRGAEIHWAAGRARAGCRV